MKCIVTGGSGFIGSNLVDRLIDDGHQVAVIDNESSESNDTFYQNDRATYYKRDIADYESVRPLFNEVHWVFHMAAESRIGPCIENPLLAVRTNVQGTSVMLQCAREVDVKRFVFSSTSSIYGLNQAPNSETDQSDCLNPYSATKLCAEEMCKVYHKLYGLRVVILRYFNVFGDREPTRGQFAPVTSRFMKQKADGLPLTIVGNGNQRRDFIHVSDVVEMNIKVATAETSSAFGQVVNVGTGTNYSVLQLARMISDIVTFVPSRSGEASETKADTKRARDWFWFDPEVNIVKWLKDKLKDQ
jgi:UDP-glucose 4-epimerase